MMTFELDGIALGPDLSQELLHFFQGLIMLSRELGKPDPQYSLPTSSWYFSRPGWYTVYVHLIKVVRHWENCLEACFDSPHFVVCDCNVTRLDTRSPEMTEESGLI